MPATAAPGAAPTPAATRPPAAPGSDRGAKPKYCDDPEPHPLSAHRERRRTNAKARPVIRTDSGGEKRPRVQGLAAGAQPAVRTGVVPGGEAVEGDPEMSAMIRVMPGQT
jgi:hypothetical protein